MSDGPHKTLPLRPSWRKLAERADNESFTAEQVSEAVCPALAGDWRAEISDATLKAVSACVGDSPQLGLFASQAELLRLRAQCGSPMAALLVDAACDAVADGLVGREAMEKAIADALSERAIRGSRQVEEHYLRKSSGRRAARVRARLNSCAGAPAIASLARAIAQGTGTARQFKPTKHDGLDQGVAL
jgi:hypothetical protein